MEASAKGHREVVEILLQNNARTDFFDSQGRNALHLAGANGHLAVVDTLLKYKAFAFR